MIEQELLLFDDLLIASDYLNWAEERINEIINGVNEINEILEPIVVSSINSLIKQTGWLLEKSKKIKLEKNIVSELENTQIRLDGTTAFNKLDLTNTWTSNYVSSIQRIQELTNKLTAIIQNNFEKNEEDVIMYISKLGINEVIDLKDLEKEVSDHNNKLESLSRKGFIQKRWVS